MKIMTVFGSPRAKGNTAKVLEWIEEQLEADGHEVDRANVVDYRVAGCVECYSCKSGDAELCAIDDDANGLYRRMMLHVDYSLRVLNSEALGAIRGVSPTIAMVA